MNPFFYWHTSFSNGIVYFCLMAGIIVIATLIFWIMTHLESKYGKKSFI
jgi:hypothetical protein